jgi:DNA-binding GntR family transcriptional regulator
MWNIHRDKGVGNVSETGQDNVPVGLLSRPQTRLADEVAQVLRGLIMRGELKPGTPLLQIQLAERLGVSRTPLREAFRILERDGLLRISNGNKTVEVVEVNLHQMTETYQIREVIDGLAARLAANAGLSNEMSRRLEKAITDMDAASKSAASPFEYAAAHAEFHLAVLEASGNSRLKEFESLVRISTQVQLIRYLQQHYGDDADSLVRGSREIGSEHHHMIFAALSVGDARTAERVSTQHIKTILKFLRGFDSEEQGKSAKDRGAVG